MTMPDELHGKARADGVTEAAPALEPPAGVDAARGASSQTVEEVRSQGDLLAVILRAGHRAQGIQFFTPREFSQQLAYMNRPAGYVIEPHFHHRVAREVLDTKEVLLIRSGRVRVDFYDDEQRYLQSRLLEAGDVALLAAGGHGFEMLEASEIVEVKQGPYGGSHDKTRFAPVARERLRWQP